MLFARLYVHFTYICRKYISLRGQVWAHKTNLTLSPFIEVSVPSQHIKSSCICVSLVYILLLSTIFLLDFEAVFHFIANSVKRYINTDVQSMSI